MLTREIESGVVKCARYWPEPDEPSEDDSEQAAPEALADAAYVTFEGLDGKCAKLFGEAYHNGKEQQQRRTKKYRAFFDFFVVVVGLS